MSKILVLLGSHDGMSEALKEKDVKLLKELIDRHHGIKLQVNDIVTDGNTANAIYREFIADPASHKYLYFVGHGNEDGRLMFSTGAPLDLSELKDPTTYPQNLELFLFMCYEYKANEGLREETIMQRQFHGNIVTAPHQYTQRPRDEMNEKIFHYQMGLQYNPPIQTQVTYGDPEQGHHKLREEVEKASRLPENAELISQKPTNQAANQTSTRRPYKGTTKLEK